MAIFLLSNLIISFIAIVHNRTGTTSIKARLYVSSFSLVCWILPFSLIRNLFPTEAAINVVWTLPETLSSISSSNIESVETSFIPSLFLFFIVSSTIGLLFFLINFYRHYKWQLQLKADTAIVPFSVFNEIPVYVNDKIMNAVLMGYNKPSIWINSRLANSKFLKTILAHEYSHSTYKDNYSLLLIALIKHLYWWNPFVRLLANDLVELIEARCDHKSSQLFSKNIYQQQLASLMLTVQTDANSYFTSAIVSKNPDIRRLQYLTEKPNMTILSKFIMSLLTAVTVILLITPISTFKAVAQDQETIAKTEKSFSMNFKNIPISMASQFIAEIFDVKNITISPSIENIKFINFKIESGDLKELSNLTNINWEIDNDYLILTPRDGGANSKLLSDEEYGSPQIGVGVLLALKMKHVSILEDGNQKIWTKEVTLWSDFDQSFSVKFDHSREVSFNVKDNGDIALIKSEIYKIDESGSKKLIASPKVFTHYDSTATIEQGDDGLNGKDIWTIEMNASKTKNPNN